MKMKNVLIWFCVFFAFGLAAMSFASNPFLNMTSSDGFVFFYLGEAMKRGLVLYRDVLDNKGPNLYLLNCIGRCISDGTLGLWFVELAFLLGDIFLIFRYVSVRSNLATTLLVAISQLFVIVLCAAPGNFSELFAYPFILLPVLILWTAAEHSLYPNKAECVWIGISFSFVFLLRVNMVTFAFVVALWYFWRAIRHKEWRGFFTALLYTCVGVVVALIPWIVYFVRHNAVEDIWNAYWRANLVQVARGGFTHYIWLCPIVIVISAWAIAVAVRRKQNNMITVAILNMVFAILSSVVICLKPAFSHYFLPLMVALIVPCCLITDGHRKTCIGVIYAIIPLLIILCLKSNFDVKAMIEDSRGGLQALHEISHYRDFRDEQDALPLAENIKDKGSVCVLGLDCAPYLLMNLHCRGRFPYQACLIDLLPSYKDEVIRNIQEGVNRYILVADNQWLLREVVESSYHKIAQNGNYSLWEYNLPHAACGVD